MTEGSSPLVDLAPPGSPAPAAAETHISVLFFAGRRVYKLCKPVDLGFVDLSTRPRRKQALQRELAVNRRFAPDVYLGVLDWCDERGDAVDHALVMRRLPPERRLAALLGGSEAADLLRDVAKTVADVHARSPRPRRAAEASTADSVLQLWETNEAALGPFVGAVLDRQSFDEVGSDFRRYIGGRKALFARRIDDGHAVDGHGDLLSEDIFCLDDGPRILDALAFDDELRYGDVLADVAFLAMDVEHRVGRQPADDLLRWYVEFSGEHHPDSLAHHYIAYRAQVRAKVECLRVHQGAGAEAAEAARRYLELARRRLRSARVRLVVVGGPPGAGKSTLAGALAEQTGWTVLRSDETRKELAGLATTADATAAPGAGIYAPEVTDATYDELVAQARRLAAGGESVILDASFASRNHRAAARDAAELARASLIELRVEAPPAVAAERIAARRARGGDASDATPEVASVLRARFDPWPEATAVDGTRPPAEVVEGLGELLGITPPGERRP